MRQIILVIAVTLIIGLAVQPLSAQIIRLGGEIELPVAEGWELLGDTSSYPFLLMSVGKESEMLVFKSTIELDGSIDNQASLKASVDRVIDSVILTLPESKLLTSSGYNEGDNVRFVLEFTSQDLAADEVVRHRMMGVLYRLSDGDQYLFTLWGRAGFEDYPHFAEALAGMQQDFRFIGDHSNEVFMAPRNRMLTFGLPILLIIAIYFLTRYRQFQKGKLAATKPSSWQCSCGTENRERDTVCHLCGQGRPVSRVK
ncbi:MAG: hypothetical protein IPH75_13475 [bacterium]|nr:hypothetical protein [bacterium]